MIILGIDPGLATTGYGIIDSKFKGKNSKLNDSEVLDYGVISTKAGLEVSERLVEIYDGVKELISKYKPEVAAIESLYFYSNQKTAMAVGQARGVVMLACRQAGLEINNFTPKQVKQAVTGYGVAGKKQIQYMVKEIYGLNSVPKPDDAADALGVCFCCLINERKI